MTVNSDYTIVNEYQSKLRGLYQYYALAVNVSRELSHLKYIMEQSLLKTLAAKHKTSAKIMRDKYTAKTPTDKGTLLNCIEVRIERDGKKPLVARFGGFSIERQNIWKINDQLPKPINNGRTELLQRLLADQCEICSSTELGSTTSESWQTSRAPKMNTWIGKYGWQVASVKHWLCAKTVTKQSMLVNHYLH
jgi:hypothetical protein